MALTSGYVQDVFLQEFGLSGNPKTPRSVARNPVANRSVSPRNRRNEEIARFESATNRPATQGRAYTRQVESVISEAEPLIIRPGEYALPVPASVIPADFDDQVDPSTFGAAGTPIVSGFVTELGEYNAQMRGRNAIQIYEQMRRSDADVAATLSALKLPIRAAEFRIDPGVESNDEDYDFAKQLAEFVKDCLFGGLEYSNELGMTFSQRFEDVIENALLCLEFGCSGYEDIWRVDGDKVRMRRMAPRLPLTFYRFHVEVDGETLRSIEQWGYRGNQFVNVVVPADKFTLFSLQQEGANFYGRSMLRAAYQHWYLKSALYRIESVACERNGAGVPVIKLGQGSSVQDKEAAFNWVQNLSTHEQNGLVLPYGWEFELKATQGSEHKLAPSIQHHSEQICRSALAMFMTLGSSATGSRALGGTMLDFFELSENALSKFICDTISNTTIRRLIDFNFGDRNNGKPLPYPRLSTGSIAVINPVDLISAVKELATSTVDLIQPDDDTENWIRKRVGMPPKSNKPRVRFAPVTQKVEESAASPTSLEDGTTATGKPSGGTPGNAPPLPGGGSPPTTPTSAQKNNPKNPTVPAQNPAQPQAPVKPPTPEQVQENIQDKKNIDSIVKQDQDKKDKEDQAKPQPNPQIKPINKRREENSGKNPQKGVPVGDRTGKEGKLVETLTEPTRALRPEELKHDFTGHVQRQDSTATAVRRILGGVKTTLVRDAARRAAVLRPEHLDSLTLKFDKPLQNRLARSLSIAHQYGQDQVYKEREKATGRKRKDPVVRQLLTEVEALTKRKLHFRLRRHGLDISIENAAGSTRTARDGSWQQKMTAHYGYIRRTIGADQDQIDCYVGPNENAENVYIVHQKDSSTGVYDEDKCFIGYNSEDDARKTYLANHSQGEKAIGPITTMTVDAFKKALNKGDGKLHYKKLPGQLLSEKSGSQDRPALIAESAVSDLNNWITSRTRGAAVDGYKKGLRDSDLEDYIAEDVLDGSDGFLDRISDESSRSAVAGGRYSAFEDLDDEIDHYVRSEAMDQNTCDPCEEGDGDEWDSLDDVDWSPGDDCDGKDNCRGQLMPVFADEGTVELG